MNLFAGCIMILVGLSPTPDGQPHGFIDAIVIALGIFNVAIWIREGRAT